MTPFGPYELTGRLAGVDRGGSGRGIATVSESCQFSDKAFCQCLVIDERGSGCRCGGACCRQEAGKAEGVQVVVGSCFHMKEYAASQEPDWSASGTRAIESKK